MLVRPRSGLGAFQRRKNQQKRWVARRYAEIYNERVRDLLLPTGRTLRVREHPRDGACVPDLTVVRVGGRDELAALLAVGSRARATAATRGNARSSRSHAVFSLRVSRRRRGGADVPDAPADAWWRDLEAPSSARSRLHLVDLAGSERVAVTGTDGARLKEAKAINRSLASLCDVVAALAANARRSDDSPRKAFVPYRNSALTWLLKDSLGGNAFATMLATVSPCDRHFEETVATLKYAARARRVRCAATVNEVADLPPEPPVRPSPSASTQHSPSSLPHSRRADLPLTNRSDAAAATRIFRGDESRPQRRGCDADIPWR